MKTKPRTASELERLRIEITNHYRRSMERAEVVDPIKWPVPDTPERRRMVELAKLVGHINRRVDASRMIAGGA